MRLFFFRPVATGLRQPQLDHDIFQRQLVVQQLDLAPGFGKRFLQALTILVHSLDRTARVLVGDSIEHRAQAPLLPLVIGLP